MVEIRRRTHDVTEGKAVSSSNVMNTESKPMYRWKDIPWPKLERMVYKLQKRIYQASRCGNVALVHRLQKLLVKSWSAKAIAVRRVTQENQGKRQQEWMG